ncbi:hypothetical protein EP073_09025 [Geovibrio thiophilus]|uniref:Uncharacterized protein n=1 Tax=Geovibrio thiophilus TaxID=139438 RepID=A0A410JZD9_9BACT|nr:hypothetical protein [Geovibrio thiophilus]QAR33537.1 hypothetical protein EP073_09025 [Geovibrio thiophilus]
MKKTILCLLITAVIFSFTGKTHAAFVEGSGSSVIHDGNVKAAEQNARESALKSAMRNFFSSADNTSVPEITNEFLKFITRYKITSRYVRDNTVFCSVSADVDEIAMGNINYYIREATNSVVFDITGKLKEDLKPALLKTASEVLQQYRFTASDNQNFLAEMPDNPKPEDMITAFASTPVQYLFVFTLNAATEPEGEIFSCEAELYVKPYSRDKEFPAVKVTGKAVQETDDLCITEAFRSSVIAAADYIRTNIIPLPETVNTVTKYSVKAVNFGKFADVKAFMDFLKRREIVKDYNIKTFSLEEAIFDADTVFSKDALLRNLDELKGRYGYTARIEGDELLLDFSAGAE